MALIQILQCDWDVTLVTIGPFDCDRLNSAYHAAVDAKRVSIAIAPMPNWLRRLQSGDALRGAYLARYVRQVAPQFDVCISGYNFTSFNRPAIQFVADFSWDDALRHESDPPIPGVRGLVQRASPLRSLYLSAARAISGGDIDPSTWRSDIIVANSRWTAGLLARRYGVTSRVIYPPVHGEPFETDAGRTGDFVMLGRITPDKRIEEAIEFLSRVRARGHKFSFHVIGPLDGSAYCDRLRVVARRHAEWVRLRGGIYGAAKFGELARHSYALHMHAREAFGIAVAEQVKMGLIPFVPAGTAPAEIVDDSRLCFESHEHAVELIDRLLRNTGELKPIRASLAARGGMFSKERFTVEVKDLLRELTFANQSTS